MSGPERDGGEDRRRLTRRPLDLGVVEREAPRRWKNEAMEGVKTGTPGDNVLLLRGDLKADCRCTRDPSGGAAPAGFTGTSHSLRSAATGSSFTARRAGR